MTTPDLDALDAPLTKARHEDPMQSVVYDDCFYSLESAGIQLAEAYDEDTAALIVAAVNALPALIARVRELERGLDDAQKLRNIWQGVSCELAADCDTLREVAQSAIALLEIDAEADNPATDLYTFLKRARAELGHD